MTIHLKPIAFEARHWSGDAPGEGFFKSRKIYCNTAVVTITREMEHADVSLAMSRPAATKAEERAEMAAFHKELSAALLDIGITLMTWRHKGKTIEKDLPTGKVRCNKSTGCKQNCEYCR